MRHSQAFTRLEEPEVVLSWAAGVVRDWGNGKNGSDGSGWEYTFCWPGGQERKSGVQEERRPEVNEHQLIGDRIRSRRRKSGLTQADLAKKLGVGPAIVGHWETGRCGLPEDRVAALEKILGRGIASRGLQGDGRDNELSLDTAGLEMDPAKNEEYRQLLLSLVPADGESIGNRALREKLRGKIESRGGDLSDKDYWAIRRSLIDEAKIEQGRGRGGSVHRMVQAGKAAPLPRAESKLYEPFLKALENGYAPENNITRFVSEITAGQGRRPTGGKWTRPDITLIAVRTFSFVPGKRLEVVTFEVKPDQDVAFDGVYEAIAHSAFAHLAFLAVHVSGVKKDPDERILQECKRFGIGYITFTDPENYDTFETVINPSFEDPDPYAVDKFISNQISSANRDRLREFLR